MEEKRDIEEGKKIINESTVSEKVFELAEIFKNRGEKKPLEKAKDILSQTYKELDNINKGWWPNWQESESKWSLIAEAMDLKIQELKGEQKEKEKEK